MVWRRMWWVCFSAFQAKLPPIRIIRELITLQNKNATRPSPCIFQRVTLNFYSCKRETPCRVHSPQAELWKIWLVYLCIHSKIKDVMNWWGYITTPTNSLLVTHLSSFRPRTIRGARPGQDVQWIYLKTQQLLLHPPRPAPLLPRRTPLSETWIRVNISHPTPSNTMVKVYAEINLCNIIRLSTHRSSSSGSQPSKQESVPLSALWGPSIFVKRHWAKVADTVFSCHLGNL